MTRNQIIEHFTKNIKAFEKLAYNIAGGQDADDLFQTCTLMLLEFSEERLISYWNDKQGLKPFFIRMLLNQYKSDTSKFHKDYRKQEQNVQKKAHDIIYNTPKSEEEPDALYFESIGGVCQKLYSQALNFDIADLEKIVWELYVEKGSLRKTLAAIPEVYSDVLDLKSIHTIVKKFRRTIKKHLNYEA